MVRVLVVDDNASVADSISECLRMEGLTVLQASNGKLALKILETQEVDWVLTDIVMPDMDGVELLRELKKRWPNLHCIAWSGAENRDLYLTIAAHLGAKQVLEKPVLPSEIIDIIKKKNW